jgi:hypothetical protein
MPLPGRLIAGLLTVAVTQASATVMLNEKRY